MFNEDQHRDTSLAQMLKNEVPELNYSPATKFRQNADQAIRDALHYVEVGGQMITPPNLYVFDTCQRFIYEMEHYRWDDWSGKNKDNKNPREKPVDKDDHEIECAGRSLLRLPKLGFRPPVHNQIVSKRKVNLDPYL
jgi:hypothetical protein